MQRPGLHPADGEALVVVKRLVEHAVQFLLIDVEAPRPSLLDNTYPLPDAHVRPFARRLLQLVLQVACRGQVISVDMCFENLLDRVSFFFHEGQEGVCAGGGNEALGRVEVEDRVDDDGGLGLWVRDDILPGAGIWLETLMYDWCGRHFDYKSNTW